MGLQLGVNVDHVATLRQARRGLTPSPVWAAREVERAGAGSIVCHLQRDPKNFEGSPQNLAIAPQKVFACLRLSISSTPNSERIISGLQASATWSGL